MARALNGPKMVVAHRGDTSAAHENTIDAFRAAIANGASAIEFDVHKTEDGVLVVHHDADVAGQALVAVAYAALGTLASGFRIPTLSEVIALAAGRVRLDIELKAPGCEAGVIAAVADAHISRDDVVITAFEADLLANVRAIDARVRTGWLVEKMTGFEALQAFEQSGAAFLGPDHVMLDPETLQEAERRGVALLPWTVNDVARMRELLPAPAVIGIITDRLADALRER